LKEQLILILPTRSTFMLLDEELLKPDYRVRMVHLGQEGSKTQYLQVILRSLHVILRAREARKVLVWFADYHAAAAVLLAGLTHKKSIVFIAGYDAVKYPEFRYGIYTSRLRGFCARFALKHCSLVVACHQALLSSSNTYYNPAGHPEGIQNMVPGLKTPASVLHFAVRDLEQTDLGRPRLRQILTVGTTPRFQDFYNKGYDLLVDVARRRTDLKFVFVGLRDCWMPDLNRLYGIDKLANVRIHPSLPHADLLALMRSSAVYAQPSISEGMPNALMEAMHMGCVPVGSNVAGIPTVIGQHGFVFDKRDPQTLESALDQALNSDLDPRKISDSISARFNLQIRRAKLLQLLSDLD